MRKKYAARKNKIRLTAKKCAGNIGGMKTPREIIEALGVDAVAARLDVSRLRVLRARLDPELPASWYVALSDMHGYDLPRDVFSFKGVEQTAAE